MKDNRNELEKVWELWLSGVIYTDSE